MKKTTQKQIRSLVRLGVAQELTECSRELHDRLRRVAVSSGIYGLNGILLEDETGRLYAVTDRNPQLYFYGA